MSRQGLRVVLIVLYGFTISFICAMQCLWAVSVTSRLTFEPIVLGVFTGTVTVFGAILVERLGREK